MVSVTALPVFPFSFVNWTENGIPVSTNVNYKFKAETNRALKANFYTDQKIYTIFTSAWPQQGGTTIGNGQYASGQHVTVEATPSQFYNFLNWSEYGNVVSVEKKYSFIVNSDRTLTANFYSTSTFYTVNITSNPSIGGKIKGGGSYPGGYSIVLEANSNPGFRFTGWTENETILSTDSIYNFTLTKNRYIKANFYAINKPTLMINPDIAFYVSSLSGEGVLLIKNVSGGVLNWSASSSVDWITIQNKNTGTGNAEIKFSYSSNPFGYRIGIISVSAKDAIGSPKFVQVIQMGFSDIADDAGDLPKYFNLMQNYPNPFNPSTVISYQLPEDSHVTLKVYNILGQEVAVLVDEFKRAGFYNSLFNVNSSLSSGVYIYQLRCNNFVQTRKMILL